MAKLFSWKTAAVIFCITLAAVVVFLSGSYFITANRVDANQKKNDRDLCELLDAIGYPRSNAAGQKFEQHLKAYEGRHCHG